MMPLWAWGGVAFWGTVVFSLWRWDWRGRERPSADSRGGDVWRGADD